MASDGVEVVLRRDDDTSVSIRLFGATVKSWKHEGNELLFVSKQSHFDNKKAIRGGIPLVFPNFGPWEFGPQHGFARLSVFKLAQGPSKDENGDITAVLTLEDDDKTRDMWNYRFQLIYTVTLMKSSLKTTFKVVNKSDKSFDFTCLLHTYFYTPDVRQVTVSGLKDCNYIDKIDPGTRVEDRELVKVDCLTDRVYQDTGDCHVVTSIGDNCNSIHINKTNFPDTVVWNPWSDKAKGMSDFGDEEYNNMICVEEGKVSQPVVLGPGQDYTGVAEFCIAKL